MKKIITTAVLALLITSAFAQGRWNQPVRNTPNTCLPPVKVYTKQVPLRTTYVPQTVVRYAEPAYHCGPVAMHPNDFSLLMHTINNASFESTKLNIFRQAMAYNYFTSSQVSDIMSLFCFESYRLDVAKMAYNRTVDPQNYYIVNNAFTFNSSVNELGNYIAMR